LPGFPFGFIHPGLGAEKSSNSEIPVRTGPKKHPQKPILWPRDMERVDQQKRKLLDNCHVPANTIENSVTPLPLPPMAVVAERST
jgi:hypothetical protein